MWFFNDIAIREEVIKNLNIIEHPYMVNTMYGSMVKK